MKLSNDSMRLTTGKGGDVCVCVCVGGGGGGGEIESTPKVG